MSRKTPKQAKLADFYANRKFSKQVRELLANGQVVEARVRCAAQTDEVLARLNGDAEYRAEYYKCVCFCVFGVGACVFLCVLGGMGEDICV